MKNNKDQNMESIIEKQIGRKPKGMVEVSLKCPFGYPAVIKVFPFSKERVFPTTYWLTCPYLQKEISVLEDKGWIESLQDLIDDNEKTETKLKRAHQNYAKERFEMLDKKQKKKMKGISDNIFNTLKNSGIGGVKDKKGLKCLHTHVADYLVNRINPVGERVFQHINWPDTCIICKEMESNEKSSN
ncbi:MAG: DUF501 domain-containing protein [Halanaerobiales bacterium]